MTAQPNDEQLREKLANILRTMSIKLTVPATMTGKVPDSLYATENEAEEAILHLIRQEREAAEKAGKEATDALYWMYSQYCSDGHMFMGAGETAAEILEKAGYITVDTTGAIIEDNGDSVTAELQPEEDDDDFELPKYNEVYKK